MENKPEKVFAGGIFFDRPREGAPDFIKGRMSIKVPEAIIFLQKYQNNAGYVNLDLKASKEGKLYLELNQYVPKTTTPQGATSPVGDSLPTETMEYPEEEINPEDIPF